MQPHFIHTALREVKNKHEWQAKMHPIYNVSYTINLKLYCMIKCWKCWIGRKKWNIWKRCEIREQHSMMNFIRGPNVHVRFLLKGTTTPSASETTGAPSQPGEEPGEQEVFRIVESLLVSYKKHHSCIKRVDRWLTPNRFLSANSWCAEIQRSCYHWKTHLHMKTCYHSLVHSSVL